MTLWLMVKIKLSTVIKFIMIIIRYPGRIWKRRFRFENASDVFRPHHAGEDGENAALGLPSARKLSFSKTLYKPAEFENAGFSFLSGRKTFWKRSFP